MTQIEFQNGVFSVLLIAVFKISPKNIKIQLSWPLISAKRQNFSQIMSFSSFEFLTILSHVRNNNQKIFVVLFESLCQDLSYDTLHLMMLPVNNEI